MERADQQEAGRPCMVAACLALGPMDAENGPLIYVQSCHRLLKDFTESQPRFAGYQNCADPQGRYEAVVRESLRRNLSLRRAKVD